MVDSVEHTIFEWQRCKNERGQMERELSQATNAENIVGVMIESEIK